MVKKILKGTTGEGVPKGARPPNAPHVGAKQKRTIKETGYFSTKMEKANAAPLLTRDLRQQLNRLGIGVIEGKNGKLTLFEIQKRPEKHELKPGDIIKVTNATEVKPVVKNNSETFADHTKKSDVLKVTLGNEEKPPYLGRGIQTPYPSSKIPSELTPFEEKILEELKEEQFSGAEQARILSDLRASMDAVISARKAESASTAVTGPHSAAVTARRNTIISSTPPLPRPGNPPEKWAKKLHGEKGIVAFIKETYAPWLKPDANPRIGRGQLASIDQGCYRELSREEARLAEAQGINPADLNLNEEIGFAIEKHSLRGRA